MPVFIPKGDTPEERSIDSEAFHLNLLVTFLSVFVVGPVVGIFVNGFLGDYILISGPWNGNQTGELYRLSRKRKLVFKDFNTMIWGNVPFSLFTLAVHVYVSFR